ncbi:MAG: type I restriction enzyme, R subunit [Candidatus Frackibacter sp. T328-2]|nr:MAG: type I restriction enzyme, R subunit [Candidatus Frackibacter sp. T328-2]
MPIRESEHEVLLLDRLRAAIKRINPWISANNLNKAVNEIRPARIQVKTIVIARSDSNGSYSIW